MSEHAGGAGFSIEGFAEQIERAANEQELLTAHTQASPEVWALKGKPAVTSLLTEGLMAIDRMHPYHYRYDGTYTLSDKGSEALSLLDQAIILNPLFDTKAYQSAKDATSPGWVSTSGIRNLRYPKDFLTNPRAEKIFPERGLASLHSTVTTRQSDRSVHGWKKPGEITAMMRMNGSLDPDISSGLRTVRESAQYNEDQFFEGVLELIRITSAAVMRRQTLVERQTGASATIRRWIRRQV